MGAVSLGYGPDGMRIRRKVSGKTKQDVGAKSLDGTSEQTRTLYESPCAAVGPCGDLGGRCLVDDLA